MKYYPIQTPCHERIYMEHIEVQGSRILNHSTQRKRGFSPWLDRFQGCLGGSTSTEKSQRHCKRLNLVLQTAACHTKEYVK
jgi:hypothetical protein